MTGIQASHHNPMPFKAHPLPRPRSESTWLRCEGVWSDRMDGDTCHLTIQCIPRHILITEAVRMDGYDAPELWGKNRDPVRGVAARDALASLVIGKMGLLLLSDGIMTVNRYPGRLFSWVDERWVDVSARMYQLGHIKADASPPPEVEFPFPVGQTEFL